MVGTGLGVDASDSALNAALAAEARACERSRRVCHRMRSRHLQLLHALSERNRERNEQQQQQEEQRQEELRARKREFLFRDAAGSGSSADVPPPTGGGAGDAVVAAASDGAAAAVAATLGASGGNAPSDGSDGGGRSLSASRSAAGLSETDVLREKRLWQHRCNMSIERRQEDALRRLANDQQMERVKLERERLKREWRAHNARRYLLLNCRDVQLREYLENKGKPRALPKLPSQSPRRSGSGAADSELCVQGGLVRSPGGSCPLGGPEDETQDQPEPTTPANAASPKSNGPHSPARDASGQLAAAALTPKASGHQHAWGSASPQAPASSAHKHVAINGLSKYLGRVRMSRAAAHCSDMAEWKRRHGCPAASKVFICNGGYPDFRDALLNRGWFQNHDKDSRHFDLKWGMANDIDHERLRPDQIVNHFDRCRDLTTKIGLSLNLRSAVWHCATDADEFYPRVYDLYDPAERADFVANFKFTKAESILRQFIQHVDSGADMTFSVDVLSEATKICMRLLTDVDEVIDCPELAEGLAGVSTAEWALLKRVCLEDVSKRLEQVPKEKELEEMIHRKPVSSIAIDKRNAAVGASSDAERRGSFPQPKKCTKKKKKDSTEQLALHAESASVLGSPRGQHFLRQARSVIRELELKSAQHTLHGTRNAWIVKPAGKSRGRGVQVIRELDEIFRATESDGHQWICQKYIENPQLIHGYKFDIRQWVLVTDWNPLTVYLWQQPYVRFAGQKYDGSLANLSEYMHLVNNSIIKHMHGFEEKNMDLGASGYMWFRQQYQEWLHSVCCKRKRHRTPWLRPPPYTCATFGVRWEDVAFVAKEEDEEEEVEKEPPHQEEEPPEHSSDPSWAAAADASMRADSEGAVCSGEASPSGAEASPASAASQDEVDQLPDGRAIDTGSTGCDASDDEAVPGSPAAAEGAATEAAPPGSAGSDGAAAATSDCCEDGECEDVWESCIKPQIADIVIWSLLSVVDSIHHRKNSVELYGYDLMLSPGSDDQKPKVWLIEVNSSPACDYSTPVTTPLVKKMMEDTAKVMVDRREDPNCDTGEWVRLQHPCCCPRHVTCRHNCADRLEVHGIPVRPPKGAKRRRRKKKKKKEEEEPQPAGHGNADDGTSDAEVEDDDGECDAGP